MYNHFHEACCQRLGHIQRFSTVMPHGNSYGSLNIHATEPVDTLKYCNCHCESIDMPTILHIRGAIVESMRHAADNWVTFKDFALSGSMPHGNNYGSLKNAY